MSNIKWSFVVPLKNKSAVEQFEAAYPFSIPQDLKQLIKQNNAGYPEPCGVDIEGLGKREIKQLLSYNPDDDETIYQVIDYFMKTFHRRVLPFAVDSFSGYYCIKDGRLVVYVDEADRILYPVAESITAFLNGLRS